MRLWWSYGKLQKPVNSNIMIESQANINDLEAGKHWNWMMHLNTRRQDGRGLLNCV